jgi:hypothetical protein
MFAQAVSRASRPVVDQAECCRVALILDDGEGCNPSLRNALLS